MRALKQWHRRYGREQSLMLEVAIAMANRMNRLFLVVYVNKES